MTIIILLALRTKKMIVGIVIFQEAAGRFIFLLLCCCVMGLFGHTYHGRYDAEKSPQAQAMLYGFAIGGGAGALFGCGISTILVLTQMRSLPASQKLWIVARTGLQSGGTFGFLVTVGSLLRSF